VRLAEVLLDNFACYAGEVSLALQAKPYAIVARHKHDPERSNAAGKTSIMEAIRFAMYGVHRYRTEDEWITREAKRGRVALRFDDGSKLRRERIRGKSTALYFIDRDDDQGREWKGPEAQAELVRRVGLTSEDFSATCYFEQRQMARLVLADPGERMGIVSSWLRLEPLERAETSVRAKAAALAQTAAGHAANLALLDEQLAAEERAAAELTDVSAEYERAKAYVREVHEAQLRNEQVRSERAVIDEYAALCAEGRQAVADAQARPLVDVDGAYAVALAEETKASAETTALRRELEQKSKTAQGQFDGRCPIAAITCPAQALINADRARSAKAYADVKAAYEAAWRRQCERTAERERVDVERRAAHAVHERLAGLRQRSVAMKPRALAAQALPMPVDGEVLRREAHEAARTAEELLATVRARETVAARIDALRARREALRALLAEVEAQLATHREAGLILGKSGAQRRVAETALGEIEAGANRMLHESGIDLTVSVQWAREGKGLARACEACGQPYPESAKVKLCPRCTTPRGPLLVNRLGVELSRRSGAMEDLGGASLQLAASAWLREERASPWSVAFLDEPFGALDAALRRAFAAGLVRMLGESGFTQSFTVAHHPSVLDALPGRIEIDGERSTAQVVA
jgi:DNA repair exonuclease SbcCD ATPase subunit